jgi:hypothetical protein
MGGDRSILRRDELSGAGNARCRRRNGKLKKTKPRSEDGVLSRDAMIALNWFMRSRIGNDAVALTLEDHRRPREVLEVRRQPLVQEQLRDRQS